MKNTTGECCSHGLGTECDINKMDFIKGEQVDVVSRHCTFY